MVDADSVVEILKDELERPSMKTFVNAKVIVGVLREYRDWRQFVLQKSPVNLAALRRLITTFLFGFGMWNLNMTCGPSL